MLCNKKTNRNLIIVLMAAVVVAGAGVATAEVSYHLVRFPDISGAGAISDSGVILAGSILMEPARDAAGNPVWDLDGDGIADGYTVTTLAPGAYQETGGSSINESLDVVGSGTDENGDRVVLLWLNALEGSTLVELGRTFTDAEVQTFTAHKINALSINDLGQVLVFESGDDESDPDFFKWTGAFALALLNPKDTNGDGKPDLWFEDADGDGANDLMVKLEYSTGWDSWDSRGGGSINNRGQVAAELNLNRRGFVVLPMDTDGDGEPDLWFEDLDGDGWNDLVTDLSPATENVALSDSGVVVATEIVSGKGDHFLRWQIDEAGNVELVAEERGACFMTGVNNLGQAVGYILKYTGQGGHTIKWTTRLWEPDLRIIDLLDLLDNPKTAQSLAGLDISNTGYIVGGVLDNHPQDIDGFVAVPVAPSPPGPGPSVDSITPNTMKAGTSIDVTINGSGFVAGADVTFENGSGPAPSANVTSVDGTTIEATVTTHRKAKLGVSWDVRVTNPDGSSDVLVGGFTVSP